MELQCGLQEFRRTHWPAVCAQTAIAWWERRSCCDLQVFRRPQPAVPWAQSAHPRTHRADPWTIRRPLCALNGPPMRASHAPGSTRGRAGTKRARHTCARPRSASTRLRPRRIEPRSWRASSASMRGCSPQGGRFARPECRPARRKPPPLDPEPPDPRSLTPRRCTSSRGWGSATRTPRNPSQSAKLPTRRAWDVGLGIEMPIGGIEETPRLWCHLPSGMLSTCLEGGAGIG